MRLRILQAYIALGVCVTFLTFPQCVFAAPLGDKEVAQLSDQLFSSSHEHRTVAAGKLLERGKLDVVASLILAARYNRSDQFTVDALSKLTGTKIEGWSDAMLWQEAHTEVIPHDSYRELKLKLFKQIDQNFMRFLDGERAKRENMKIRLEEITWGGVQVDGIPSLDNPEHITAKEANYLRGEDLVFGVEINGDVRAYPLRIMGWHEMFNETIGGVPVALAYCTLCGAGILFETQVEGRKKPFVFGSSGFLYRSNKLMFDRETDSLWNQFTGKPVAGPLVTSGIELKIRPVAITSWEKWKKRHPDTKVLSLETGHRRDYGSGVVYRNYFESPKLMFPAIVRDETVVKRKDYVFGIRDVAASKAWPVEAFNKKSVLNDTIGRRNLVLIGDAITRTVRAYERNDFIFMQASAPGTLKSAEGTWRVTENHLIGPSDMRLARVPGHVSYWFAWDGYLGVKSELYKIPEN